MIIANISTRSADADVVQFKFPEPVSYQWYDEHPMLALWLPARPLQAEGYFYGSSPRASHNIGTVMFVPGGRQLVSRGTGGAVKAIRCRFSQNFFEETIAGGRMISDAMLEDSLDIRQPRIRTLLQYLMEEILSPRFGTAAAVESLSALMLVEWARAADTEPPRRGGIPASSLRLIDDILNDVDAEMPTVASLSELCQMRVRTFAVAFRRQVGRSIRSCLADAQRARAQHLLANSNLPLKQIAFRLGFSSAANFSTAFRNATGVPPATFRSQHANTRSFVTSDVLGLARRSPWGR